MKISWGYKIATLYGGFVIMMISMVVLSASAKPELEREDYYEEELKHDQKMEAIKNMNVLGEVIAITPITEQLVIDYPAYFKENGAKVKLWVYNASNAGYDKKISYTCNERSQIILTKDWPKGAYQLRFNVIVGDKTYYQEKGIHI